MTWKTAALFLSVVQATSASADSTHFIRSIVQHYQPQVQHRWGKSVKIAFHTDNVLAAYGGHDEHGELVIEVYGGITDLPNAEALFVVCHELGHILGHVSLRDARHKREPDETLDPRDAVEGEADYFGGACVEDYLQRKHSNLDAKTLIAKTLTDLYGRKPDENAAATSIYQGLSGINDTYPAEDCRFLSAIKGAENQPRPKCWYNP